MAPITIGGMLTLFFSFRIESIAVLISWGMSPLLNIFHWFVYTFGSGDSIEIKGVVGYVFVVGWWATFVLLYRFVNK